MVSQRKCRGIGIILGAVMSIASIGSVYAESVAGTMSEEEQQAAQEYFSFYSGENIWPEGDADAVSYYIPETQIGAEESLTENAETILGTMSEEEQQAAQEYFSFYSGENIWPEGDADAVSYYTPETQIGAEEPLTENAETILGTMSEEEQQAAQEYFSFYSGENIWPEGDADAISYYQVENQINSGIGLHAAATEISASQLVRAMLNKVGSQYSQANREAVGYYDCSSLVRRCLAEIGITSNVPDTTSAWNSALSGLAVGQNFVLSGTNKKITYRLVAKNIREIDNPALFSVPGTIMIYMAPGYSKGHIAVSLGSFARQNNGYSPNSQSNLIVAATKSAVANALSNTYGVSNTLLMGKNSVTNSDNLFLTSDYLGTDMNLGNGYSGVYNSIFRVEAANPKLGVCVNNMPTGLDGDSTVRYVLQPVSGNVNNEPPTITSAVVTELSSSGYCVTVAFSAPAGLAHVNMPTWTNKNGQDDLVLPAVYVNGNVAAARINVSEHNNENGIYHTHIYVTDVNGKQAVYPVDVNVPAAANAPTIQSVNVSDVTSTSYKVTVTFTAAAGLKEVVMPTWTELNGQDDLIWHKATVNGTTAYFTVRASDHNNERGLYNTHIYVRDINNQEIGCGVTVELK